jgi:hypothetical protein
MNKEQLLTSIEISRQTILKSLESMSDDMMHILKGTQQSVAVKSIKDERHLINEQIDSLRAPMLDIERLTSTANGLDGTKTEYVDSAGKLHEMCRSVQETLRNFRMIGIEISVKIPDIKYASWRTLTTKASREGLSEPIIFDIAEVVTNDSFNSSNLQVVKAIDISPYIDLNRLMNKTLGEVKQDIDLRPVCLWDMTGYVPTKTDMGKRFTAQTSSSKLRNSADRAHLRDFQVDYIYFKANIIGIEYGLRLVNYDPATLVRPDVLFSNVLNVRITELVMEQIFNQVPNLSPNKLLDFDSRMHQSLAISSSRLGISLDSRKFSKQKEIIRAYEAICGSADSEHNRHIDSKLKIIVSTLQSRVIKKVTIKQDKNTSEPFFEIKWDNEAITNIISSFKATI